MIFIGCEEDLIPHRTLGSDVSEERRLFYVGVTRAKERLILTRAMTRKRFGKFSPAAPSRFLLEIPPQMVTSFETGFRPVGESERKNLMADLFKKLEQTAARQKPRIEIKRVGVREWDQFKKKLKSVSVTVFAP